MQLHPVDTEAAPAYPRASGEARALRNLSGMQNRKQSRVNEQSLRVANHLGEDLPPQRLQEAPQPPQPPMERGRVQPHHTGEQVREEPLGVAQERALALYAPQLLEEGEGDDFRVGKPLEGLVVSSAGIEMGVSVVHEAEEDGQSLFRVGEAWGMVELGHPLLLREVRLLMAPFLSRSRSTQHTSSMRQTHRNNFAAGILPCVLTMAGSPLVGSRTAIHNMIVPREARASVRPRRRRRKNIGRSP
jgi:hypothetical protein